MKKKLFIAGMTVNVVLAGVLAYSIYSSNQQIGEVRRLSQKRENTYKENYLNITHQLESLKLNYGSLKQNSPSGSHVTVQVSGGENNSHDDIEVMTSEEVLNFLKIQDTDESVLDNIDNFSLNGKTLYLKKDVVSWLKNEIHAQKYPSNNDANIVSGNTQSYASELSLEDLSEMINIPVQDLQAVLDVYPDAVPFFENRHPYDVKISFIKSWLRNKYPTISFELKSYGSVLNWGDTARYLNTSMERVEELLKRENNPLPHFNESGLLRFDKAALDTWLASEDLEALGINMSTEMDILEYIKYQNCDPEALLLELSKANSIINYKLVDGRMVFSRDNKK